MFKAVLALVAVAVGLQDTAVAADTLTIETSAGARQPQLAIDGNGRIHLAFGAEGSIFYTSSEDQGVTFAEPAPVAKLKALALGMRRGPRIAVAEKAVVITAIGGSLGGGRDGDLFAWRSGDNAKSWQGPVQINGATASAREGLHAMAAALNGDLYCVWLDLRNKRTQLFGSRSTDGGATWSDNVLVYESPDGSICECCHPSVAYDQRGSLHVLWRNSLGGNRDMYWTSSNDGGRTFAKAVKLGRGTWPLDACPMDGGALAIGANGQPAALWRRDTEIFLSTGNASQERGLGRGMQPWLAANDQGVNSVWLSQRPGDLFYLAPGDDRPIKLASQARDPVIAAGSTSSRLIVTAWETEENGHSLIKVQAITGNATRARSARH